MKKLALFLFGLGSLAAVSVSAANYSSAQPEPQYQEQYDATPCATPIADNQVPCDPAPCAPDTVCAPAPCNPAPCDPAPCNPGC